MASGCIESHGAKLLESAVGYMPCNDITEIIQIRIDPQNRISNYSIVKQSCGSDVTEHRLILDWLQQYTADEILETTTDGVLEAHPTDDEVLEYLILKSYLAVRSGIAILLGKESGTKDDFCTVDSIKYGPKAMIFTGFIKIDAITEKIKACGKCGNKN